MAGTVTVKIVGDATSLRRALGESESAVGGFTAKMQGVGSKMRSVGLGLTAGLAAPLALIGKQAVEAASNLQQSAGAVESVFGPAGRQIEAFGRTAAQAFGLSRREVNETAAVLGAQLQSMGRSADEAAAQVITLQERAADMAATFGGTTTEALEAISSLMRGERDPIERYGVSLKDVDIQARIAADGLDQSTAAAKKQSEATAAMSILLEQTTKVQGQFARESDTAAGAQARATAQFENSKAVLGEALLPIMTQVMNVLGGLAQQFANLSPRVQKVVLVGGGLLAVLGPVVFVVGSLITAVTAAIPVITAIGGAIAALSAPIVLIGLAIAGLAVLFVIHWDTIKRVTGDLMVALVDFFTRLPGRIVSALAGGWTVLYEGGRALVGKLREGVVAFAEGVGGLFEWFRDLPGKLVDFAAAGFEKLVDLGEKMIGKIVEGIKKAPGAITDAISDIIPDNPLPGWIPVLGNDKGDAPGSFRGTIIGGGKALSRVQDILGQFPGARITSTYRSPEHNKRVGGAPGSLHMDARNPAVDIGGPTAVLDRLAAHLARIGGWRQLLWRVKGHYDHIHAAHTGEDITSSSPGKGQFPWLRPNERLRRVEEGESIITAQQKRSRGGIHIENLYAAPGRTLAEELALAEALYGQGA